MNLSYISVTSVDFVQSKSMGFYTICKAEKQKKPRKA